MKFFKVIVLSTVFLSSSALVADKPVWAGNGGKPSAYEKEEHKRAMTSKNKDKKNKYDKDYDERDGNYNRYSRDYDDRDSRDGHHRTKYEGQGQSDGEFIEQKTDETKKNWIGKFFDFLN